MEEGKPEIFSGLEAHRGYAGLMQAKKNLQDIWRQVHPGEDLR